MLQWTWDSLSPQVTRTPADLVDVLNTRLKALQGMIASITNGDSAVKARVATTDGTVTTLATEAIQPNNTVLVWGYVIARRTGAVAGAVNDGAAYRVEFVAKNTAGTATVLGSAIVTVIGESQAGWDCTVTASGGNVLVRVTGSAQNNVVWKWNRRQFMVADMNA